MAEPSAGFGQSPLVLPGVASQWPALQLWRGKSGLDRLKDLAGSVKIQVMISREERFVGDMQHLRLLECVFTEFLDGKLRLSPWEQREHEEQGQPGQLLGGQAEEAEAGGGSHVPSPPPPAPQQLCCLHAYLAQCPIMAPGRGGKGLQPGPLHALMEDISIPPCVPPSVNQINFWASTSQSRSSLHYDPYQNLLVVVRGSKTVRLVPPSATPLLAPQPIYHESANHSPADLAAPDPQRFPALAQAQALPGLLQTFTLQPGDGLFIPEGWWHQVHSEAGTVAVNFWWESAVSEAIGGIADRYYFRRLAQSLLEAEKQRLLGAIEPLDLCHLVSALPAGGPVLPTFGAGTSAAAGGRSGAATGAAGCQAGGGSSRGAMELVWRAPAGAALSAEEEAAVRALSSLAMVAREAAHSPVEPSGAGAGADSEMESAPASQLEGPAARPQPTSHKRGLEERQRDEEHGQRVAQHAQHVLPHAQQQVEGLVAALAATAATAAELPGEGACGGAAEALPRVLLALRERDPAAARWLLLEGLSPAGWELLLARLEQLEEEAAAAEGSQDAHDRFAEFYDRLYSACGDAEALLAVMLARKEQFAQRALRRVLEEELSVRGVRFAE